MECFYPVLRIASLLKPTSQQVYIYRKFTFSVVFVDKIISVALIYSRFLRFLNICCQTVCKLTVSNLFHSSPASFWSIVPKTTYAVTSILPNQAWIREKRETLIHSHSRQRSKSYISLQSQSTAQVQSVILYHTFLYF